MLTCLPPPNPHAQEETGITRVADPWGGSYFMESLTSQLECAAEALLQEVEGLGGMTEALLAGTWFMLKCFLGLGRSSQAILMILNIL
jgi:hypothetical protein